MPAPPTPDTDRYAVGRDATAAEFLAAAKVYARRVVDARDLSADVSALDWDVSTRAKRRAGAVKYRDGDPETVSLTFEHFRERGWTATAAVVRHELIHVHRLNEADDPTHGDAFRELAAELRTPVHCERFADPDWWVVCEDCGTELARYRKSKLVKQPDEYRCRDCGGPLSVREAEAE